MIWFFFIKMFTIPIVYIYRKESETTMKVCNNNWSDEWSNFVCRSLGFTEMKTTTFHTNESTENSIGYLKLKDDSNLNNSKSFTDYLEQITSCDTYVEIKCSSKNRKILFNTCT